MQAGDVISWTRTFSERDVKAYSQLSGDAGTHHVLPDHEGRLMVQGLLTATLPSKVGGDINFIARQMIFEFHRPVYTGDTIRCEVTIVELTPGQRSQHLSCTWTCTNQTGEVVMTGSSQGIVRNPAEEYHV